MVICRCLPHGYYCTIITLIVTVGFILSTIENPNRTCHYSIVSDVSIIQQLTQNFITPQQRSNNTNTTTSSSIIVPYVQVGYNSYRIPTFYASTNTWIFADDSLSKSSATCIAFPKSFTSMIDIKWRIAQYCKYIALIVGGSATIYLWLLMILPINKCSWRFIAIELVLACIIQLTSLLWFRTNICTSTSSNTTSTRNENEYTNMSIDNSTTSYQLEQSNNDTTTSSSSNNMLNGTFLNNLETITTNMITTSTCTVSIGAKLDIYSSIIWLLGSFLLCIYYPHPRHMNKLNDNITNSTDMNNDSENSTSNNNNTSDGLIVMVNHHNRTRRSRANNNNTDDTTSIGHSTVTRSMNTTSTCLQSTFGQNGRSIGDDDDTTGSLRSIQTNFTTKYTSTRTRLDSSSTTSSIDIA